MADEAQIRRMVAGDTRTMLEAETANEVIDAVNKIIRMEVKFVAAGGSRLEIAGSNAVLFLSVADFRAML